MGTSISFPYNQTVQAFTPSSGTYQNVTFVLCATSNGFGGGQIQPTASSSTTSTSATSNTVNYSSPTPFPYNIDADGSSTSALCFLLNPAAGWINQAPPYYFVAGSTGKNVWLYTLNPAASGDDFTSSNIVQQSKVDSFDTEIASLFYYNSLNLLFVGGDNGNLYTYSVTWSSTGVPSFTSQGGNKNYTSPTGCAVSFSFFYNPLLNPSTTNSSNGLGQYVPAGSYQNSSSGISITLSAQCLNEQGQAVASSLTYTSADAATIGEISNNNGKLTIVTGSDSSTVTNQFGQYVPAGNYQSTSSAITVTITATCSTPGGGTASSTLVYPAELAQSIVDITNNNGELVVKTPVFLIVTGLNQGSQNGAFYFPVSTANNGVLPNALGMLGNVENTVSTVVDQQNQTIYVASQTEVVSIPFSNLQSQGTQVWNASANNQLILSMTGVINSQGYTYNGNFGSGALVVGTVASSSSATNTTPGSLYALDPIKGYVYVLADATLSGSPFSLSADANYHLFVNYGATGLDLFTLPGAGNSPQPIGLIPNVNDSTTHGWVHWLVDGLILAAVIVFVAVVTVATDGAGDVIIADGASDALADSGGEVAQLGDVPGLDPVAEAPDYAEQSYGSFSSDSSGSDSVSSAGSYDSDHPCTLAGSSMYLSSSS